MISFEVSIEVTVTDIISVLLFEQVKAVALNRTLWSACNVSGQYTKGSHQQLLYFRELCVCVCVGGDTFQSEEVGLLLTDTSNSALSKNCTISDNQGHSQSILLNFHVITLPRIVR